MDKDIELLKQVIEYNKKRHFFEYNGIYYEPNKDYERILKSRYQKISRIHRKFIYLLSRYDYIWFCSITSINIMIIKCKSTKPNIIIT